MHEYLIIFPLFCSSFVKHMAYIYSSVQHSDIAIIIHNTEITYEIFLTYTSWNKCIHSHKMHVTKTSPMSSKNKILSRIR